MPKHGRFPTSIRMDPTLQKRLRMMARRRGQSMGALIVWVLEGFVNREETDRQAEKIFAAAAERQEPPA